MTRLARTLVAVMFSGSMLVAQIPNPLNLPDPLGLSKKPTPSKAEPRTPREGQHSDSKNKREKHHDNGKHKGQDKHQEHRESKHDKH
jgi:hypothetical protein